MTPFHTYTEMRHHQSSVLTDLNRGSTTKRGGNRTTRTEDLDQTGNGSPHTHTRAGQTTTEVEDTEQIDVQALPESTDIALPATVVAGSHTSGGVVSLARKGSIFLGTESDVEDTGESVGEVENEGGADHTGDTTQVGNSTGDDEGNGPVDGAKSVPEHAAAEGGDIGEVKELHEHLLVDGLHANVEVENCIRLADGCIGIPIQTGTYCMR